MATSGSQQQGFTLFVGHMWKHVPEKMVFSVFRKLGIGMMRRGGAIEFREYDNRKTAKIHFDFPFTRGGDGERNAEILDHLRNGGEKAHFELPYQEARTNPKTGKPEPQRFWKVSLWNERTVRKSKSPGIVLSGGSLGKKKKTIKLVVGGRAQLPRQKASASLPPLDLTGLEETEPTSPIARANARSPAYSPASPAYSPQSPSYSPTSPDQEVKKSVSFSGNVEVREIPPMSLSRHDADNRTGVQSKDLTTLREKQAELAELLPDLTVPEDREKLMFAPTFLLPEDGAAGEYPDTDEGLVKLKIDYIDDKLYLEKRVKFQEQSPHKNKTPRFARYEEYKTAGTLSQAITAGATNRDLRTDIKKGYVTFC